MKLHWQFIKLHIASRMAYRGDFFLSMFTFFFAQLIGPIIVGVIYYAGGTFPGWTFEELLLLQGSVSLVQGFAFMLFFGILWHSQELVRQGRFDLLLIKPVHTLRLLIMNSFDSEDISQFIGGIAVTGAAFYLLGLNITVIDFLLYLLLLFVGVLFYFALAVCVAITTIRFINTSRLYEFVDIITSFARYPKQIYSPRVALFFSTALPLLIAGYFPAAILLGFPLDNLLWSILSVIALVFIVLMWWNNTLKWYASAGG